MTLETLCDKIAECEARIKSVDKDLAGTAETYSRISGYVRPLSAWNEGKYKNTLSASSSL